MTKHIISIMTLLVVSLIAVLSIVFDTRDQGHLTTFGYAAAILTGLSFLLGVAAELHSMRQERKEEAERESRHAEQKHQLGKIEAEVRASTAPLIPISLFYSIRHTTTEEAIASVFANVEGYKSAASDTLQVSGTVRIGGPLGYNPIQMTASESHCVIREQDLEQDLEPVIEVQGRIGESAIRQTMSTKLEFYFPEDGHLPSAPSLTLSKTLKSGKPTEIKRLELFDEVVFQDAFVRAWEGHASADQRWSISSLVGARMRLSLTLLYFDGFTPSTADGLHDLQLFFGPPHSMHGIHFPTHTLSPAQLTPNPSPLARSDMFTEYLLEYDLVFTEDFIDSELTKVIV